MSAPYRDAHLEDRSRERAILGVRGAAFAFAALAAARILELLAGAIERSLVSSSSIPSVATRVGLVVGTSLASVALAIGAIHYAASTPRTGRSRGAWIALAAVSATSIAAASLNLELYASTIRALPIDQLSEYVKGIETTSRVSILAGPTAVLVVVAYCILRWRHEASRASPKPSAACPHCGRDP